MSDIVSFILLMALCLFIIILHVYAETYAEYRDAIKAEVEKDKEEFGYCCELESGKCTFQPKIDKLNKADPHHKQKNK